MYAHEKVCCGALQEVFSVYGKTAMLAVALLPPKSREAEKFGFEPWPRVPKLQLRKISFRREILYIQKLDGTRFSEFYYVSSVDDLDHSGPNSMQFETVDRRLWRSCDDQFSRITRRIEADTLCTRSFLFSKLTRPKDEQSDLVRGSDSVKPSPARPCGSAKVLGEPTLSKSRKVQV